MKYLVAGGAGFIGSNLCSELSSQGHEVFCVDNLVTGRERNIRSLHGTPGFTFIEHDLITGVPDVGAVDGIIHLASPASPPGYTNYALETMRVNSEGTMHLLELAASTGAPLLFASTSEVYGDPLVHPQQEGYRGNVSCNGPRSMYDESKRYGEALVSLYARTRDTDARIIRIFNTYGPNSDPDDGRIVPNFIMQALHGAPMTIYGSGEQTRSLCFVSDLVDGIIRALHTPGTRGEGINLGNPEEHPISEFAEIIRDLVGSTSAMVFTEPAVGDDPQRRCPDITKAQSLLGWEPVVPLREGLMATIAALRLEAEERAVPASPHAQ